MYKIEDGRSHFYQWDINRKIQVEDASIKQLHFSNAIGQSAYVIEVKNGFAEVPNILLQQDYDISVYGFDGEATKHSAVFEVVRRSKPDTYVYTETEALNYNQLMKKLDEIDENIGDYVQDYLEENPPEVDLTGYAKSEEIPNKISQLENDSDFINSDDLTDALDDLSDALEGQIPDVSNFVTNDALAAKGYLTQHQDLSGYAKKTDIPSTTGLATETYVNEQIAKAQLESSDVDLSNYYTKAEVVNLIPDTSGFALSSEIPDVSGYQTAAQVETAITNALNGIGVAEQGAY